MKPIPVKFKPDSVEKTFDVEVIKENKFTYWLHLKGEYKSKIRVRKNSNKLIYLTMKGEQNGAEIFSTARPKFAEPQSTERPTNRKHPVFTERHHVASRRTV